MFRLRTILTLTILLCSLGYSYAKVEELGETKAEGLGETKVEGLGEAKDFVIRSGETIGLCIPQDAEPVVESALEMLRADMMTVLQAELHIEKGKRLKGSAKSRQKGSVKPQTTISCQWDTSLPKEGFCLEVDADGTLSIKAHDSHALAYAVLELSRLMGVSPWEWWADCTPRALPELRLKPGYRDEQHPAVAFRGIFINDEDWGLTPWATRQLKEGTLAEIKSRYANGGTTNTSTLKRITGAVGPDATERIFQLMLRLRMNYYWPPMHECTLPFFLTDGNREMARRYGIYMGGSHCEPMACSAAAEWGLRGKGEYDYVHNAQEVRNFWRTRLEEVKGQDVLYTIGMRGVHDGAMQGAKTLDEQTKVLGQVIHDQRTMLEEVTGRKAEDIPQLFVPYKEVLSIYRNGLQVPEDVTLMWTDDNYGYIRQFPTEEERKRKGGNALYYHISYWGRPHDYLWLDGMASALMAQQMTEAYHRGIQQAWMLNVGDIKPAEYNIELFMDMAWHGVDNINWQQHRLAFYQREFGTEAGAVCDSIMREYQRLSFVRRPEHMGGTRVEESDKAYWSTLRQLSLTEEEKAKRIADYRSISNRAEALASQIAPDRAEAYLQLVKYPVQGAAQMNFKFLTDNPSEAYDSIRALTSLYNANPRWEGILTMNPRNLPVYGPVDSLAPSREPIVTRQPLVRLATSAKATVLPELGYSQQAVQLPKEESVTFEFDSVGKDSIMLQVALLPNHPVSGQHLSFALILDGEEIGRYNYETHDRSEEWKQNVLRNQALRTIICKLPQHPGNRHSLVIKALTEGVVLDEVYLVSEEEI